MDNISFDNAIVLMNLEGHPLQQKAYSAFLKCVFVAEEAIDYPSSPEEKE